MEETPTPSFFGSDTGKFFQYSTFVILLLLILAQYANLVFRLKIIPDVVSIGVALVCVFYLWVIERKNIEELKIINEDLLEAREALKASHVETILSLVLSQEAKDPYTYGHSERVRRYAILLAEKMGLPREEIEVIGRGAKLHDIGKIGIKDEILFFKGKLNEEQFVIIKSHPVKGVTILEPLKFLEKEIMVVRHHHERYDGTGYPDKLKGEDIPLGARIVCVADSLDAMKSQRPYRSPLTKDDITLQFVSNSGTQFDPKIIKALVENIESFFT